MEVAVGQPELSGVSRGEKFLALRIRGNAAWTSLSATLLSVCSIVYFLATILISGSTRLWMDEVLVVWTARLHPAKAVWDALVNGSMLSPPTYHYLIHTILDFGGGKIALRLPSILAVYAVGLAAFFLMRRRFSLPISALAMALCLETGLFPYATQVREYALVTGCFALAVLLWDIPSDRKPGIWRVALITILLALGVALHFYAVLLVPVLGLMELLWSAANRRIRFSYWVGMFLAGASIFAWFPLISKMTKLDAEEVHAVRYYARPTLKRLLFAYQQVALGSKAMSLLIVFAIVIALLLLWRHIARTSSAPAVSEPQPVRHDLNLEIIIFSTVAIPLVVFLFAAAITHTFNERYAIAGCFGFSLFFAYLLAYVRWASFISCVLLLSSVALLVMAPSSVTSQDKYGDYGLAQLENTPSNMPVVVGEGLVFFEVYEEASPQLRNRLFYLDSPRGVVSPDPTNELILGRWRNIRPDLNVVDPQAFLGTHSRFFVFHTDKSTDVITPWLIQHEMLQRVVWQKYDMWLFEAGNPAQPLATTRP